MSNMFKKSTLLKTVTLTAFGLAGLSAVAIAKPKADIDQNGEISQAEFIAHANQKFSDTDTNFDGVLSQDEIKAHREAKRAERRDKKFGKLDGNNDGFISQNEYGSAGTDKKAKREARRLEKADSNKDGVIDEAEKAAMQAKRAEKRAEREAKRGDKPRGKNRVKRDANGDGFVTQAEHEEAVLAIFARLDANGDGVLTKGEGKKRRWKKGR